MPASQESQARNLQRIQLIAVYSCKSLGSTEEMEQDVERWRTIENADIVLCETLLVCNLFVVCVAGHCWIV